MADRVYTVYARCGYYPADSDIAQETSAQHVPRVMAGTLRAVSASDAGAKMLTWCRSQIDEMVQFLNLPRPPLIEVVAVTEQVPSHEELLTMAEQMEADEAARKVAWAANKSRHGHH